MSTPKRALAYVANINRDPRVREGDMPEGMTKIAVRKGFPTAQKMDPRIRGEGREGKESKKTRRHTEGTEGT